MDKYNEISPILHKTINKYFITYKSKARFNTFERLGFWQMIFNNTFGMGVIKTPFTSIIKERGYWHTLACKKLPVKLVKLPKSTKAKKRKSK